MWMLPTCPLYTQKSQMKQASISCEHTTYQLPLNFQSFKVDNIYVAIATGKVHVIEYILLF